jgi:hypothetical protein
MTFLISVLRFGKGTRSAPLASTGPSPSKVRGRLALERRSAVGSRAAALDVPRTSEPERFRQRTSDTFVSGKLDRALARWPRFEAWQECLTGVALIGLGLRLIIMKWSRARLLDRESIGQSKI